MKNCLNYTIPPILFSIRILIFLKKTCFLIAQGHRQKPQRRDPAAEVQHGVNPPPLPAQLLKAQGRMPWPVLDGGGPFAHHPRLSRWCSVYTGAVLRLQCRWLLVCCVWCSEAVSTVALRLGQGQEGQAEASLFPAPPRPRSQGHTTRISPLFLHFF